MRAVAPSAAEAAPPRLLNNPVSAGPGVASADFAAWMAPLGPFGPTPHIIAGVSGGPHSLALILLLQEWTRMRGGTVLAGLVDHSLRADSAAEVATVAGWMRARGIAVRIARLGLAPGPGTQARARSARLAALGAMARAEGAGWLALGQHRGDQAETLLLRSLAGSGATGLAGMAPARSDGAVLLIRPLLGASPAVLEAVLAAAGMRPLRDPSNDDPRFTRVRLRKSLSDPAGEGAATAALADAAAAFGLRRRAMQDRVAARLAAAATLSEAGFARLDLPTLGRDAVALAALGALVRAVGGGSYAPGPAALAGLLARGAGTLGGARLTRHGLLLREAAAMQAAVPAVDGAHWDGRFRLEGRPPPGLRLGAFAGRLKRPDWLPGAVVPTLPALWHADGTDQAGISETALAAVPWLSYPSSEDLSGFRLRFLPLAGPVG